eukprot:gnl/Chilomastix_cuspidata/2674.p1 GENE.gnl/Chilomastix_cuspidata/2674~~gnl/Chilomastix_cuspidata/2674.p1  ORF type:complete len:1059 (-),score=343.75 gnl/Chilomastix_cuspidata/2674:782-3958(-)
MARGARRDDAAVMRRRRGGPTQQLLFPSKFESKSAESMNQKVLQGLLDQASKLTSRGPRHIPPLKSDILNKLSRHLENAPTLKNFEAICTIIAFLCVKEENREQFLRSSLLPELIQLASEEPLLESNAPAFLLRLMAVASNDTEASRVFLSKQNVPLLQRIVEKQNPRALKYLSALLVRLALEEQFASRIRDAPRFSCALASALGPDTLCVAAALQYICEEPVSLDALVEGGLIDALERCFISGSLFSSPPLLVCLQFVASTPRGALRLCRKGIFSESLRGLVSGAVPDAAVAPLLRAANLVYFNVPGSEVPETAFFDFLERLGGARDAMRHGEFVGVVAGLAQRDSSLKEISRRGLLSSAFALAGRGVAGTEHFIPCLNAGFMRAAALGAPPQITPEVEAIISARLEDSLGSAEEWQYAVVAIQGGARRRILQHISLALENAVRFSRDASAAIYTTALVYYAFDAKNGAALAERVPRRFIADLKGADPHEFLDKLHRVDFSAGTPLDFSSVSDFAAQFAPNALLCAFCGALRLEPAPERDRSIHANLLIELWASSAAGAHDAIVPRVLAKTLPSKAVLEAIDSAAILAPLCRALTSTEPDTLMAALGVLTELLRVRSIRKTFVCRDVFHAIQVIFGSAALAQHEPLVAAVYKALRLLASVKETQAAMGEYGFVRLIISSYTTRFATSEEILADILKTLWWLIFNKRNLKEAVELGGIRAVTEAAVAYGGSARVQHPSLACLKIFAKDAGDAEGEEFVELGALDHVVGTLRAGTPDVLKDALTALHALLGLAAVRARAGDALREGGQLPRLQLLPRVLRARVQHAVHVRRAVRALERRVELLELLPREEDEREVLRDAREVLGARAARAAVGPARVLRLRRVCVVVPLSPAVVRVERVHFAEPRDRELVVDHDPPVARELRVDLDEVAPARVRRAVRLERVLAQQQLIAVVPLVRAEPAVPDAEGAARERAARAPGDGRARLREHEARARVLRLVAEEAHIERALGRDTVEDHIQHLGGDHKHVVTRRRRDARARKVKRRRGRRREGELLLERRAELR